MNAEIPAEVSLVSEQECLYVVPLNDKGKMLRLIFPVVADPVKQMEIQSYLFILDALKVLVSPMVWKFI